MDHRETRRRFATLTTAHLADACIRAQIPVRCGPALLQALVPGSRLVGRASPARHVGSVDVFLEALERAAPGDFGGSTMADDSMKVVRAISWL